MINGSVVEDEQSAFNTKVIFRRVGARKRGGCYLPTLSTKASTAEV